MTIHREGYKIIFLALILLDALGALFYYYLPYELAAVLWGVELIFFILIVQFFRNPKRKLTTGDDLIIAPADGKVVVIEEAHEDEYLKDKRKQVSIFMSPLNVHINRMPIGGEVAMFKYHPGKFLVAWHPKSSTENERTTMAIKTDKGVEVLVRQIAGAVARRIRWYVKDGDRLKQNDEFGFIKFGSRVDLFLPLDAEILVEKDQITKGGVTQIARLK